MKAEEFISRPSFSRVAIIIYRTIPLAISLYLSFIFIRWLLFYDNPLATKILLVKPYQGIKVFWVNILGQPTILDWGRDIWVRFHLFENFRHHDQYLLRWDMTLYGLILWLPIRAIFKKIFGNLKYWFCPYCFHATRIFEDWQCNRCHHPQGKERYITSLCNNCRLGKMIMANCEYCHRRFWL
jgi:hypothetical protein